MQGSQVRQRLHDGRLVYGTQIASLGNPVAAAMTVQIEMDFAFFCTEHMPLDRTEVAMLCQFYLAHGISPIVRVTNPDPALISQALDGGAEGIVVPYVETPEQVRQAVGAVKYRPVKGQLLQDVLDGRETFPGRTQNFLRQFNESRYLIIGIESRHAIDHLESLITIDGVDGVFLGPHDISTTLGIPTEYENPLFLDTIEDVIRRCRNAGVGVGIHMPLFRLRTQSLRRLLDAGMNWIVNGSDITLMRDAMNAQLHRLRCLAGEPDHRDQDAQKVQDSLISVQTCID